MIAASAQPRVVFLNRFYWPDVAATGQMLTDLAEDLAAIGWHVTVIASTCDYQGGGGTLPRKEQHNGVRILRVHGTRFGRHRTIGRLLDYLSYLGGALIRLVRLRHLDLVVGMSDPPFVIAVALMGGRFTGARVIFWVQDLFPQIAARLGVLSERGVGYRVAKKLARWLHSRCDLVIALGPRMAQQLVAAGAPPERTTYVHNWADASAIRPIEPSENDFLAEQGLGGRFIVLYSGNAGRAHPFDAVMHAARSFRNDAGVVFLFIGGGARLPELRATAQREALSNVRFLDYLPRERLAESLSAASVSMVTEEPSAEGLLVPSKAYGILASGRPLIFVGSATSDVAQMVEDTECGVVVDPTDGDGLVQIITALRHDPVRRGVLGENARRAAEKFYGRRHATARWAEVAHRALIGTHVTVFPVRGRNKT